MKKEKSLYGRRFTYRRAPYKQYPRSFMNDWTRISDGKYITVDVSTAKTTRGEALARCLVPRKYESYARSGSYIS